MGGNNSARRKSYDARGEVDLSHFQILRAIGKGSFGKVCIVQKKDSQRMFAMKYMNKRIFVENDAIRNVVREMELLRKLDHPFLVNLWFTFQDDEDMFMVADLLLGGDLRYHIQQGVHFNERQVKLYLCEIALALDYLRSHRILHRLVDRRKQEAKYRATRMFQDAVRDVKPDNLLLNEEGHIHLTDFNVAIQLQEGQSATSLSGTKPYMAPEVFACALDKCPGYTYPADWWSLGVCVYEMLRGKRPYDIRPSATVADMRRNIVSSVVLYPPTISDVLRQILKKLLSVDCSTRLSTLAELKKQCFVKDMDLDKVLHKQMKPTFVPSKDHLNCDPTYELEEMIIEEKPLHKKKKRLAKQNSRKEEAANDSSIKQPVDPLEVPLRRITHEYKTYNREKYLLKPRKILHTTDSTNHGTVSTSLPEEAATNMGADSSKTDVETTTA